MNVILPSSPITLCLVHATLLTHITFEKTSEQQLREIGIYVGAIGGIVLVVIIMSVIVFVVAFTCLKKRKTSRGEQLVSKQYYVPV